MKKEVIGFVFCFIFLMCLVTLSAYNVGPLIDQGLETHISNESLENEDIVYQEIIKNYKAAGLTEEDLINDIEEARESSVVVKTATTETKKVSSSKADKETEKTNERLKGNLLWTADQDQGFFQKFLDYVKSAFSVSKPLTGKVIDFKFDEIELPDFPEAPGNTQEVLIPTPSNIKAYSFMTGHAILGIPNWAYDGEKQDNFELRTEYIKTEGDQELHHFELDYRVSVKDSEGNFDYNRGVAYNKGYYLNEKQGKWEEFSFKGSRIRQTDWLLASATGTTEEGDFEDATYPVTASLTLSDYTDNDYAIFLTYSCKKPNNNNPWECNDGKWVLFVVETGDLNYHVPDPDTPTVEYSENADLDISNLPSLLEQLGLGVYEVQPTLHDLLLVSPQEEYEYGVNEVGDFKFFIKNLGNKKVENIEYEIDIGEKELVDVVSAALPKSLEVGETQLGKISLKFKERGKWKFPISVVPKAEEVDTSDNFLTFNVTVGDPITVKEATDPIDQNWNREIDYNIKEPYTEEEFEIGDGLWIKSGTDKVRTVFGDYRGAAPSEFPRMRVDFLPIVSSEAIDRYIFFSSIFIGAEMLAGDKEIVKYYLKITDDESGEVYTTPEMESNYNYYYNPKELIPNFQFCRSYSAEVMITSNFYDTILFEDPKPIYVRDESCAFVGGKSPIIFTAKPQRILKLDGDYLIVTGSVNNKIILDATGSHFSMSFEGGFNTPPIKIGDVGVFKLEEVITKKVNFEEGEEFKTTVSFPNGDFESTGPEQISKYGHPIYMSWESFSATAYSSPLVLKNEFIIFSKPYPSVYGTESNDWNPQLAVHYNLLHPFYYDSEVIKSINEETRFDFVIKDETEGEVVYHGKDLKLEDLGGDSQKNGRYKRLFIKDEKQYRFNSGYISIYKILSNLDAQETPKFVHGHIYYLYPKVVSSNAQSFSPAEVSKIYYIDPYQLLANNPLLRTRFLNMQNAPSSIFSRVKTSADGFDIPEIMINYVPKNLFYNPDSNKVEKLDTSQREIKLSQLFAVESIDNKEGIFNEEINPRNSGKSYVNDGESIDPLFNELSFQITPLEIIDENLFKTRKTKNFNCKIGKYDGVCYRDNSGYIFLYVDEVNLVSYRFILGVSQIVDYNKEVNIQREVSWRINERQSSNFIVQNRQNPSLHDSIVYDILSEIDRNPVNTLELKKIFEKKIERPDKVNLLYEPIIYSGEDVPLKINSNSEGYSTNRGDYPLQGAEKLSISSAISSENILELENARLEDVEEYLFIYDGTAKILNFDTGEIIRQKGFDWNDESTLVKYRKGKEETTKKGVSLSKANDEVGKWFHSLGLEPYVRYSIDFQISSTSKPGYKIGSYPVVFTHRQDYVDLIVNQNKEYLRKISELDSTILTTPQKEKASEKSNLLFLRGKSSTIQNSLTYINERPQQNMYDLWQAKEFITRGPLFSATFMASPSVIKSYEGDYISEEEFLDNGYGENKNTLISDKAYKFSVYKLDDIYDWFLLAPSNDLNTLDTELTGVVCYSSQEPLMYLAFPLYCRWGDINELTIYTLHINKGLSGRYSNVRDVPQGEKDDLRTYAEIVLSNYLEWYPPTSILNTTYQTYY